MKKEDNFYAIILSGGSGERFWPLSTPDRPKQFLSVFGGCVYYLTASVLLGRCRVMKYDTETEVTMPTELDAYAMNNFENVLKKYSTAGVPLVIVSSPKFRPTDNNKRLAAICEKHGIPFIDFYDTPYFNDHPELIYDANHLNDDGAHVYTALFFEQLKTYLPMP